MDEHIKPADLSYLTPAMVSAARDFVDLKFQIDTVARKSPANIPDDLHGPMGGGEYGPYNGSGFFNNIIPFLPRDRTSQKATVMAVPVAHSLGCSWNWWPDNDKPTREKNEIISRISSEHGIRSTSYTYIPELGLFLPGEGKNRVNFCRFHDIEHVLAQVCVEHYPEAERIKVYITVVAGGRDVWAVLDNRFVQKVSHYAYALPLLKAYGVTVSHKWPEDLPALYVLLQNERYCSQDDTFYKKVIDVNAVREVLDKTTKRATLAEQYVRCGLLDLPLRKKFIYLAWVSLVWLVSAIAWGNISEGVIGEMSLATLAFTSGILTLMMAPVLQVRRKHLDD